MQGCAAGLQLDYAVKRSGLNTASETDEGKFHNREYSVKVIQHSDKVYYHFYKKMCTYMQVFLNAGNLTKDI